MAGWHHWLDGRESEWTPGVGDGQGGLVCCDSWGRKESDATDWLNWTKYGDRIPAELFKILKDDAVKVLHSTCQQIWKTQQWPQDWKRSVFIPIPKKGNAKGRWNYHIIALISHARLQQYMNKELPDVQAVFWRGRGTTDQIVNICGVMEKAREFQKNIYFCIIDYTKAFDCVDHNKLWKIIKEMGISDHFSCLLGNLYVGQEATVRTGHGKMDWFQIGKGVCQGCILSPCQSTSCKMLCQMTHKLESRLPGEIWTTSDL